ncbi:MAG: DUF2182 domain-containing protein [Saccharospirillum sp.]
MITLLAWIYLMNMGAHSTMNMGAPDDGGLTLLATSILMWSVMMVAMMLPSATPMILTYTKIRQQQESKGMLTVPTGFFIAGYLSIWLGFAVVAALMQWGLHQSALLNAMKGQVVPSLGGIFLIIAGLFQFSGLKQICLSKCRSPLSFLMTEWRGGVSGAFLMGVRHGAFCTGCCWALMLLMFVGGVMQLLWMAGLTLYFLGEKLLPWAQQVSRVVGSFLVIAGLFILLPLELLHL